MPTKNRVKVYVADAYYHVYNRGVNKQPIFIDNTDYSVFLNLFKRYLADSPPSDSYGRSYENISDKVEVLAYCLMPNHFHLLVYQKDEMGMANLLRRLSTTYSVYFNRKYHRVGQLFQDAYKASRITSDGYLQHISRYIHLNPDKWRQWDFSSLGYYLGNKDAPWINQKRILGLFKNRSDYMDFLADYQDYKRSLDKIKSELADK